MKSIQWGIIGCGTIAGTFARALAESQTGTLLAAGSRRQQTADDFAQQHGATRSYGGYDKLLADNEVEAVYIATPHPWHVEWAIQAAAAGKHILVEKPIGMNRAQAQQAIDAARRHKVFLMEAFMYRCHPQTRRLAELVRDQVIGSVQLIRANFSYQHPFDPDDIIYSNEHGGGGILDVGCYPVSLSRLIAGAAVDKPFAEPIEVKACGFVGRTQVDEYSAAVLHFENGIVAQVLTGINIDLEHDQWVEVIGDRGRLVVPQPWLIPRQDGSEPSIVMTTGNGTEHFAVDAPHDLYRYEADEVAHCLHQDRRESAAMSWSDTVGNMEVLDRWRAEIGLTYAADR